MGKFISDVIGEEFKEWKRGDIIILAAPTGCGKSTFVLEKLLPYAAERDEKVLYLVNRKILKEQIVERIEEKESVREQLCIKVSTYQHLEEQYSKMVASNNEEYLKEFRGFTYIIADECHYFSLDALYNTRTELSYRWIKNCTRSIVVYISATMENVESRIREDFDNLKYEATNIYEKELLNECFNGRVDRMQSMVGAYGINLFSNLHERIVRKYQMPNNNCEHIEVNYVASIEELCDLMKRINEKWLVFVDSKDKGREMEKKISKGANKNECLFIDAHFRRDEDASEEVERIAENSYYKSRVLIVTPVLDNGVSLIDNQLRNIVIMTDMKDSFFQMLGRKRGTNQKINLYLMSLTVREIRERYRFYDKLRAICNECEKEREKAFGTIKGLPSLEQYQITSMQEVWNGLERTSEGKCESDYKEKYLCYARKI